MDHVPSRERDRLLTGAYLALAGVAVGAGIAWAFLRPANPPAPVVIVSPPAAAATVAAASPGGAVVYPSPAFFPRSDDGERPSAAAPPVNAGVTTSRSGSEEEREDGPTIQRDGRVERRLPIVAPEVQFDYRINTSFTPGAPLPTPPPAPSGSLDESLSFALEAVDTYIKGGYTLREDTWGGDLPVGEGKAITHQLFKGNDYWFCLGTNVAAKISVHIHDGDGNVAEETAWHEVAANGEGAFAAARIIPRRTGTYFIIVKVERSPEERTAWGLVYAYK